ncbi:hypothetical protein CYMTET_54250 [Cymbomonas tetramitiformis]|uniref:Uncharacterized protein n=1 Tax=Cymbomonas tetramitiformis TaxID=36881 RepID=A0AAE0BFB1_9CHLO|nr:hypothetical protein CYMTET_54250 [Cymbomonas tetramitiformis]
MSTSDRSKRIACDEIDSTKGQSLKIQDLLQQWVSRDKKEVLAICSTFTTDISRRILELVEEDGFENDVGQSKVARDDLISRDEHQALQKLLAESRLTRELLEDIKSLSRQDLRKFRDEWIRNIVSRALTPTLRDLTQRVTDSYDRRERIINQWSAKRAISRDGTDSPPRKR